MSSLDNDWMIGVFISGIMVLLVCGVLAMFNTAGDNQAHFACVEQGIPSDKNLTYMYGIWTERAICIEHSEIYLDMEDYLDD